MIIEVADLLNPRELEILRDMYRHGTARDGVLSAEVHAARVKNNRELALSEQHAARVRGLIVTACNRLPYLVNALAPKMISSPLLSLYETGMAYGSHIDSAIGESRGETFRSDISCTVFLDDPNAYDGGELYIETEYGDRTFKAPAGHAVFYPTLFRHQVKPVSRGLRRVCVFWAQSLIRDPRRRLLIFELAQASSWLGREGVSREEIRAKLTTVRENLYRMWLDG